MATKAWTGESYRMAHLEKIGADGILENLKTRNESKDLNFRWAQREHDLKRMRDELLTQFKITVGQVASQAPYGLRQGWYDLITRAEEQQNTDEGELL